MLEELSSRQLADWAAYAELEPFGYRADWARFASISQVVANSNRGKSSRVYQTKDFMPDPLPRPGRKQSVDEMRDAIMNIAKLANNRGDLIVVRRDSSG